MYKRNFSDRKEAYRYTAERISTVKDPTALLRNYVQALSKLPPSKVVGFVLSPTKELFHAFALRRGAAFNEIIIDEDGEITI